MADITMVSVDLDDLDLDEETRALLESCIPEEAVDIAEILTEEKIAEAMVAAERVKVY